MDRFIQFFASIINFVIVFIVHGFVLMKLWTWLIVPIFKIQAINFPEAIAIFIIVRYLQKTKNKSIFFEDNEVEQFELVMNNIVNTILSGLLFIALGWIIKQFI